MKNIALIFQANAIKLSGGIGTFLRCTNLICNQNGWNLVAITDQKPNLKGYENINFIYPDDPIPVAEHKEAFPFKDSLNFERCLNLRNALLKAHRYYLFDVIIANNLETYLTTYFANLSSCVPVVYYSHDILFFVQNDEVRMKPYIDMNKKIINDEETLIGTHTNQSLEKLFELYNHDRITVLPMTIDTLDFLDIPDERISNEVLFIGTNDKRKNFIEFVRFCNDNNLNMRILTSYSSMKRMKQLIHSFNFKGSYTFGYDLTGDEKVKFISKAEFAYQPTFIETYGMNILESMYACPTLIADNTFFKEFHTKNYPVIVKSNSDEDDIKALRNQDLVEQKKLMKQYFLWCINKWKDSINDILQSFGTISSKIEFEGDYISVEDYLFKLKNRKKICFDDIIPLYNQYKYLNIKHLKTGSYICKDEKTKINERKFNLEQFFT